MVRGQVDHEAGAIARAVNIAGAHGRTVHGTSPATIAVPLGRLGRVASWKASARSGRRAVVASSCASPGRCDLLSRTDNHEPSDSGLEPGARYTGGHDAAAPRATREFRLHLASDLVPLAQIATAAGITAARIALWEKRWGWPIAVRDARGRRCYPASLIPDLREAARRSDRGRSLREDIRDGVPVWRAVQARPRQQPYDVTRCANVPEPRTSEGRRLRGTLLEALAEQDEASVSAVLARLPTIHPADRYAAVMGVLWTIGHPRAEGPPPSRSDIVAIELPAPTSAEPSAVASMEQPAELPGSTLAQAGVPGAVGVEPIITKSANPAPKITAVRFYRL